MKRYALALDLQDDPQLIAEYERLHRNVAAEIKKSITDSGILCMEIFRFADRMFMIIEATDDFSFDEKAIADAANPIVQEWERSTWRYQKPIPGAKPGEKWVLMDKIFELRTGEETHGQ
ncbi:L-rhamnose mutarotase [Parapedobacter pyrenivorans]|uniref:L-rhamnose mutarotase n=1 Tax=Parapedobacter pyrenivorans TaxID=1305674 RepID=UPI003341FEC0